MQTRTLFTAGAGNPHTRGSGWAGAGSGGWGGSAAKLTGLSKGSVANVSQRAVLDEVMLDEHVGRLPRRELELVPGGIDVVLGR